MSQKLGKSDVMLRFNAFKIVGILLSSPSWAFFAAVVLFWSEIDDHIQEFFFTGLGSYMFTSCGILSFIHSRGDADVTYSDILWIAWAALPYLLVPFYIGYYLLYITFCGD